MPLLEIHQLRKRYGSVEALRGITFTVERGEFFGLLGPNGAGKSTTINILLGLILADGRHPATDERCRRPDQHERGADGA